MALFYIAQMDYFTGPPALCSSSRVTFYTVSTSKQEMLSRKHTVVSECMKSEQSVLGSIVYACVCVFAGIEGMGLFPNKAHGSVAAPSGGFSPRRQKGRFWPLSAEVNIYSVPI